MEEDLKNMKIQKDNEKHDKLEKQREKNGKHVKEKTNKKKSKRKTKNRKENKKNKEKETINKKVERFIITTIIILAVFTFVLDIYYIYTKLIPKFKNIKIEIGYEKELRIEDFITKEKYVKDSKVLTDLSQIDFNKVRRI